jgi:exopolysaccharide biosynthesis polyprenyl glycosylphosphotransferase
MIGSGPVSKHILSVLDHYNGDGDGHANPLYGVAPAVLTDETDPWPSDLERRKIQRVVVALDDRRAHFPIKQLLSLRIQGIPIVDDVSFYEEISGRVPVEFLRPNHLIFGEGFQRSAWRHLVKRAIDLACSALGIIMGLPFFFILPILIKIGSKGPIFYCQERVGFKGSTFNIIKFRTMVDNAEGTSGPVWAGENDPRITKVGWFMRKCRLDELPQLINIFRGEMSFVGPRPERPFFVKKLQEKIPYYAYRFTVKPGLTGWAQIQYAYASTLKESQEKFCYDLYYIKHLSPLFDLAIIFDTLRVIFRGHGAR